MRKDSSTQVKKTTKCLGVGSLVLLHHKTPIKAKIHTDMCKTTDCLLYTEWRLNTEEK